MCMHLCLVEQVTGGQELLSEVGRRKPFSITVPESEECIRSVCVCVCVCVLGGGRLCIVCV